VEQSESPAVISLSKIIFKLKFLKYGMQIPLGVKIGFCLNAWHGMSVVINPTAVIANKCNISQFCTIGCGRGLRQPSVMMFIAVPLCALLSP
jgi:serine O-acetyltransferase